jgi:hypothetical protein
VPSRIEAYNAPVRASTLAAGLVLLFTGCASPAAPVPPAPTSRPVPVDPDLAAAADPDSPDHEAGLERWEEAPWEAQCDRLRTALRSADPKAALFAAEALGPEYLSLEEIHLQADILVRHPEEVLCPPGEKGDVRCPGGRSLGSPDILRLLDAVVSRGGVPASEDSFRDLHRITIQDHLPGLAALLERARGETFGEILWMSCLLADNTDRHHAVVEGTLHYVRAVLLAEAEGRPIPARSEVAVPSAPGPIPESLRVLMRDGWAGKDPRLAEAFPVPKSWLARWMLSLGRKAGDLGLGPLEDEEQARWPPDATGDGVPDAFSPDEARRTAERLALSPPPSDEDGSLKVMRSLPLLEAACPEAVKALLRRWEETAPGDGRWPAMLEHLHGAEEALGGATFLITPVLVEKDKMEARGGPGLGPNALILRKPGPDTRELLEKCRRERHHGLYWPATADLAILGDAAARAEFLAMLREDRIGILDLGYRSIPVTFTLNGDPEALAYWRSRVGSNCCLWFYAEEALGRWYPTMPTAESRVGDPDGNEERVRLWWEKWKDRLRWSRLADGWVPAAE